MPSRTSSPRRDAELAIPGQPGCAAVRLDGAEASTSAEDAKVAARLEELLELMASYLPNTNLDVVRQAGELAISSHHGMRRKSGEPYAAHPIEVGHILARMQLDPDTIAGALLHDVVEDTEVSSQEVGRQFGPRSAKLVEGVTKLGRLPWTGDEAGPSREKQQQAESLRKMFLAMVDDIGVVLVKLADRLHNMRTLDALPREKQVRIAQQTMEIYAPLANRLGIWPFKSELEDLSFKYVNPDAFHALESELDKRGRDSAPYIDRVKQELLAALAEGGIEAEITGRAKHIYSIYRKMKIKHRSLDEIYDVIGLRVLVDDRKDCYGALGIIHENWHPIPGEFDDYIATPKESMYQSLHTAVIGPEGRAIEIQIRTHEMHRIAENGVAAHWRYKEGGKGDARVEAKVAWLRQLMDWRDQVADAEEFVESLKSDVFQEMIYVFTPAGDIIELPAGATPVDFAYRIHTDVGHRCVGSKVNDQLVPLDYRLQNGQVVKVMTSKTKVGPSRDWLLASSDYVTTASAREKIRRWFRSRERDENIAQGREILDRELRRLNIDLKPDELLKSFPQYPKMDDFLAAIGYGAVSSQQIATRIESGRDKQTLLPAQHIEVPRTPARLSVMGAGNLLTNLASCCTPVSGDQIVGYVTRGRGITVHRQDCSNVANLPDLERLVPVTWGDRGEDTFPVTIRVRAWDRVGFLKDVSTLLADEKVNILSVLTTTHDDRTVTLLVTAEVEGISQLSKILRKLEGVRDVYEVRRDTAGAPAQTSAGS